MKKAMVLLLSAVLILSLGFVFGAGAEVVDSGTCGDGLTWTLDSEGTLTISGTGPMTDYSSSGSPFRSNDSIKKVVVENGVTSIGTYAFYYCQKLEEISLPYGIETIGAHAFHSCSHLPEITIPDSVLSIGDLAFTACLALTEIVIPDSVTTVGNSVLFSCTGLKSIYIGSGVSKNASAFNQTSSESLESITVSADNQNYHSAGNCLIETGSGVLILGCKNSIIPTDGSVTKIWYSAFSYCSGLRSISIPASVTSIQDNSFENCSGLEEIYVAEGNSKYHSAGNCLIETGTGSLIVGCNNSVIPDDGSVLSIAEYAFFTRYRLTEIIVPDGVVSIGSSSFYGCTGLVSVYLPKSLTSIGSLAFYDCHSLESINIAEENQKYHSSGNCLIETETGTLLLGGNNSVIPDDGSVTAIAPNTFRHCAGLGSIIVPDSVISIGNNAFVSCSGITSLTLGKGVETIGQSAFKNCTGLQNVDIPDSVKSIGSDAFSNNQEISSLSLGKGVETIGQSAFSSCYGITSLTIPKSVTEVNAKAFFLCRNLSKVFIHAENAEVDATAFNSCRALADIYYSGTEEEWNASNWKAAAPARATVHFNYSYTFAPDLSYAYEDDVLTVSGGDIPAVTGEYPYEWSVYASECAAVVFGEDVDLVGSRAFADFGAIEKIALLGDDVTLEENAFDNCGTLRSVIAKGRVTCGAGSFDAVPNVFSPYPVNGMAGIIYSFDSGTLSLSNTSETTAAVNVYDLMDMIAVLSEDFGMIDAVAFYRINIEEVSYRSHNHGATPPDSSTKTVTVTLEIAGDDGEFAPASFNDLNARIAAAEGNVTFRFVYDDGEESVEDSPVVVRENPILNAIRKALAGIASVLSKLFRLIRLLAK